MYTQVKTFFKAFAGCNYSMFDDLTSQLRKAGYQWRKGDMSARTPEEAANFFLRELDPKHVIRIETHDIVFKSGYPAPNDNIYANAVTVYYNVEDQQT